MASGNAHSPSYTYSLNQCYEGSLASLYSILRAEKPLRPDDRVWIENAASALSHEITLAEEHITRLQAHCDAARQHLALYHSAMAPIRRLPRDVLVSIFEHAFHGDYLSTDVGKPPWTLGQVCRSWRDIVVSAHGLWSTVMYTSRGDTRDTVTEIMEEYLRRSGQHPLTIVLRGKYHAPVYNLILKESHRWKLLFAGPINSDFASCLSSLAGGIPQLEELYLENDDCNVFLQAPRLRRVWTFVRLSLPSMEHITHYSAQLKASELNTISESLFPSLITCDIELCDSSPSDVESPPILIHNSHIENLGLWGDLAVLHRLVLPGLTTLRISDLKDPPVVSIISSFIQRSSCNLTTLSIRHHHFIDSPPLPRLGSLVNLQITVYFQDLESHVRALSSSEVAFASILPRLHTLIIVIDDIPASHEVPFWATFIDILERRHSARRLETFRIVCKSLPGWMEEGLTALHRHSELHVEMQPLVFNEMMVKNEFLTSAFWKSDAYYDD
ncbi:hypothetical protein BDZ89DRAFT_1011952 [Hymenopellis radicata]|nr:hypothetical protein BDZ89DRAFT_1011952 [Hymenopellis radicata]